jgi:hypothetical protein
MPTSAPKGTISLEEMRPAATRRVFTYLASPGRRSLPSRRSAAIHGCPVLRAPAKGVDLRFAASSR